MAEAASVDISTNVWPLVSIAAYLLYPKGLRIHPSLLHGLSIAHNAALVLFSAYTFITLFCMILEHGLVFKHEYYFQNAPCFDTIIKLFYLSKYYEFVDTFLLHLNGKSPSFLQKYHHIGAVVCWHLHYIYRVDAIWIPTIANSFVHTIMYSYYLGCLLKFSKVRSIKQFITTLQLAQLGIPGFICLYYYVPPIETEFNYNLIIFFVQYVFILVLLFVQFYYSSYLKPKLKKGEDKLL